MNNACQVVGIPTLATMLGKRIFVIAVFKNRGWIRHRNVWSWYSIIISIVGVRLVLLLGNGEGSAGGGGGVVAVVAVVAVCPLVVFLSCAWLWWLSVRLFACLPV